MKQRIDLIISTSPETQPSRNSRKFTILALHQRHLYGRLRRNNTVKESDPETGLYYFGARYLDPKTGRWLSGDPALGEYVPGPGQEPDKLSGMGGVFNYVNLHVYHYAGNNPVKLVDPDGNFVQNNTTSAFVVRTEDGDYDIVGPGGTYFGKVDGVIMQDGTIYKISDTNKFDFSIPAVNIKIRTNEINIIVGQDEDGNFTFDLPDFHSVVLNWLGDILKGNEKTSSGSYGPENRPEDLEGWWTGAINTFSEPSTWNETSIRKRLENYYIIVDEGIIPEDWMQY